MIYSSTALVKSKNKTHNAKTSQEYIKQILNQLLDEYQKTKQERNQLAFWEKKQEFTILGCIEMFTNIIRGYAFQTINNDRLVNSKEIFKDLQKLKIFETPYFNQWYFSEESNYPQIKQYIETLNYLRLLIIEYINDKQL